MSHRPSHPRSARIGRLAAGLAVAIGLGAAVGVWMSGEGPDGGGMTTSLGESCSGSWALSSAAL